MDARHTLKCDIYQFNRLRNRCYPLHLNNDADFLHRLATALGIRPNHEYWCKCTWRTNGINKTAKSDTLDLRWQLGFQWHRGGIELVFKSLDCFTKRLFYSVTIFVLLHKYFLFETSPGWLPGWRGFFNLDLVGEHSAPMYLLSAPRVFRRFKRCSCYL